MIFLVEQSEWRNAVLSSGWGRDTGVAEEWENLNEFSLALSYDSRLPWGLTANKQGKLVPLYKCTFILPKILPFRENASGTFPKCFRNSTSVSKSIEKHASKLSANNPRFFQTNWQ